MFLQTLNLFPEKLTVTPAQARSFAGVGGINFKRLQSETGKWFLISSAR
jgi:hypothetical protein